MDTLTGLVKTALVPGSMSFLVLGTALGVVLLYLPGGISWGRRWLVLLLVIYFALATPAVSRWLEHRLHPSYPGIRAAADARGATAIVVLGNGVVMYGDKDAALYTLTRRTSMNVIEGARLYKLLGKPTVMLSGGIPVRREGLKPEADLMAEAIVRLGVPKEQLVLERESTRTAEQAVFLRPHLAKHKTFVLVTTPIHMSRTLELFAEPGRTVVAAPSEVEYTSPELGPVERYVPHPGALRSSELVLYEYLAVANNWIRGWRSEARDVPQ